MSRSAAVPPDTNGPPQESNFGGKPYNKRPPFPPGQEEPPSLRGRNRTLSKVPSSRASSERSRRSSPERTQSGPSRPRRKPRRRRRYSDEYSRSPSPRPRSRSRHRPSRGEDDHLPPEFKPWFKKKTLWATIGTIAGVASVVATGISAQATNRSAQATQESARATKMAANASHRSADASSRIADISAHSARAAINTAVAAGYQDHKGRYVGPMPPNYSGGRRGSSRERRSEIDSFDSRPGGGGNGRNGHRLGQGLLEYAPMAKAS
ncbi:Hypothetical predicted protein [Lecanosticta acicola]|uniref:Uncharacterized protein n=1 Tax=Lecanosticta acicola TaxID=111012 RepID=A0AAI8YWM0_9PEZI|nr:Hypothetical predicted protein [Lecanosticta acicola]